MSNKEQDFAPINIDVDERRPIGNRGTSVETLTPSSGGSNVFTAIVLVVAIGACAASAYLYTQLETANKEALRTDSRLQSLEQRLSATGEEMGNSTVALQVKVTELADKTEELWEQMDRLWASAWRRNQEEIKTLNSSLANLKSGNETSVTGLEKEIETASGNIQQMLNRINGLNEKLVAQANDILAASVNAEQAGEVAERQATELKQLNDKIKLLESRNTSLLNKISDLESLLQEIAKKTV
jgi:DNA repair exonuclease SbcCD ATPase subunit